MITNIDYEHLENYGGFGDLQQAFVDFANKVPFYGAVVACADDALLGEVLPRVTRRVRTYGVDARDAMLTVKDVVLGPLASAGIVVERVRPEPHLPAADRPLGSLSLTVPGRHNLQNALAAVSVGLELGVPFERIASGLAQFRGAERRFELRGEPGGILLVDDYGHHPTEIAAVLEAAKPLGRRIVVAFQPHRHTRTAALFGKFGPALAGADHIVLTGIYAAGEDPIPGVTLDDLAASIRHSVTAPVDVVPALEDVPAAIARVARPGDVVITLGAGSIGSVPERVLEILSGRSPASIERRGDGA